MKLLSIGNSFSQDAQRWLADIAAADGYDLTCTNLLIGGCSLERHAANLLSGAADYALGQQGLFTGKHVSLPQGVALDTWDVVTLQQVSDLAGEWDSYEPYLTQLYSFVRRQAPSARVLFQETWAYEMDSTHKGFARYDNNQSLMYARVHETCQRAAAQCGIDLIPTGTAIQQARRIPAFDYASGGRSLHRDGFHLSWDYGRYLAGAVWYGTLTGRRVAGNPFVPQTEAGTADPDLIFALQQVADAVVFGE